MKLNLRNIFYLIRRFKDMSQERRLVSYLLGILKQFLA